MHVVTFTNIIANGGNAYWLLSCWRFYHQMFWGFALHYDKYSPVHLEWWRRQRNWFNFIKTLLLWSINIFKAKSRCHCSKNICLKKTLVCLWKNKRCNIIKLWEACRECRGWKMCDKAAVTKAVPEIWDYSVTFKTNTVGSRGNKYCSECRLASGSKKTLTPLQSSHHLHPPWKALIQRLG